MLTQEEAKQAVIDYGSKFAAVKALGITRYRMDTILKEGHAAPDAPPRKRGRDRAASTPAPRRARPVAKSDCIVLDDILDQYDIIGRVLSVIEEIPDGHVRPDESIRTELGIGESKWRAVRNSTRVSGHVIQLPDRVWVWGSIRTISEIPSRLRELLK